MIVWSQDNVPIFLYAWHVLKAWCLWPMEEIKDKEMRLAILDGLHKVMYMSINPYENIESFKDSGRKKVVESFGWHKFGESWTQYFWSYYYQFGMLTHFHYWVGFCYWISYISNYFHSLNFFENNPTYILFMHYVCCCRIVDDWLLTIIAFQPRYTSEYKILSWGIEMLIFSWNKGF